MTNSQEVNFVPSSQDAEFMTPRPQSAKNYLPKWFKDMPTLQPTLRGNRDDGTAKKCPPFLDALTSGYTQELICDVEIINLGVDPNTKKPSRPTRQDMEKASRVETAEKTLKTRVFTDSEIGLATAAIAQAEAAVTKDELKEIYRTNADVLEAKVNGVTLLDVINKKAVQFK